MAAAAWHLTSALAYPLGSRSLALGRLSASRGTAWQYDCPPYIAARCPLHLGWPLHRYEVGSDLQCGVHGGDRPRLDRSRKRKLSSSGCRRRAEKEARAHNPDSASVAGAYPPLAPARHSQASRGRMERRTDQEDQQGLSSRAVDRRLRTRGGSPCASTYLRDVVGPAADAHQRDLRLPRDDRGDVRARLWPLPPRLPSHRG